MLKQNTYQSEIWDAIFADLSFERIDELLDGNKWHSVGQSPYLKYVIENIKEDYFIHESGCGIGQWLIYLHKKGYKNLYGLDFAKGTIKAIQQSYPSINFKYGNITASGYQDDYFDAIMSWSVIDHLDKSDLERTLDDYRRILKPDGIVFVTVPFKNWLFFSPWLVFLRKLLNNTWFKRIFRIKESSQQFKQFYFTKNELSGLMKSRHFFVEKVLYSGHEFGLSKYVNSHFMNKTKIFLKNKSGRFEGLSKGGQFICNLLKSMSDRATADEIFFIAIKK
ncbi:MAG: class I SAM-dependent methyltransferase [Bacteroidales bacterium]